MYKVYDTKINYKDGRTVTVYITDWDARNFIRVVDEETEIKASYENEREINLDEVQNIFCNHCNKVIWTEEQGYIS